MREDICITNCVISSVSEKGFSEVLSDQFKTLDFMVYGEASVYFTIDRVTAGLPKNEGIAGARYMTFNFECFENEYYKENEEYLPLNFNVTFQYNGGSQHDIVNRYQKVDQSIEIEIPESDAGKPLRSIKVEIDKDDNRHFLMAHFRFSSVVLSDRQHYRFY